MTELPLYLLPTVAIAAFITSVAIRSRQMVAVKVLCIAGLAAFLPLTLAGFSDLLGRPKPASLELNLANRPDATVIAATMEEGQKIWLWVAFEGSHEPRAFSLPWSMELAKQLRQAQADGQEEGTKVKMRLADMDRKREDRSEPVFYAVPPEPLPPKVASSAP